MHQTISGETPRKKVFSKDEYQDFYDLEKELYFKFKNSDVLYQHGKVIKNIFNYLNKKHELTKYHQLKKIICKEYEKCESIFPFLGELFLYFLFEDKKSFKNYKSSRIKKKDLSSILFNAQNNENVKVILKYFIENCSVNYNVFFEESNIEEIVLEKNNTISLDNVFDYSFFNRDIVSSDYVFFLVNGYIDSISEIHHALYTSSENKNKDYVIFCLGMSDDVKINVMKNNSLKNTRLHIVSFDFNEENVNIMSDLSAILGKDVITADKGQTISQAFAKKETLGKHIKIDINNKKLILNPNVPQSEIKNHLKYLKKRSSMSDNEVNKKYLTKRIKNISANNFKIFLPKSATNDFDLMSDLNYGFNVIKNMNLNFINMKNKISKKEYAVPYFFAKTAYEKSKSINMILKSIDRQVLWQE